MTLCKEKATQMCHKRNKTCKLRGTCEKFMYILQGDFILLHFYRYGADTLQNQGHIGKLKFMAGSV